MQESLREGLDLIEREYVQVLMHSLDTGEFQNMNNRVLMQSYNVVFKFSDTDLAQEVYQYYISIVTRYITSRVTAEIESLSEEQILFLLVKHWEKYKTLLSWLYRVFYKLDKFILKKKVHDALPLVQAGLNIFRERVIDAYLQELNEAAIHQITNEREGYLIDRDRLKTTLLIFIQVGMADVKIAKVGSEKHLVYEGIASSDCYYFCFQSKFLGVSRLYYAAKSRNWISTFSCPEYVQTAQKAIEDEENRADSYLDQSTKSLLLDVVQNELILQHAHTLVEQKGLDWHLMFSPNKREELKDLLRLFKHVESTLACIFEKLIIHISRCGIEIAMDQQLEKDAVAYTKALLSLKMEIDDMLEYRWDSYPGFQQQRDRSFQNFINKNKLSAPHLAYYCDWALRKGLKGTTNEGIEQRLEDVIYLFLCMHDRDVFIQQYTYYLYIRTLNYLSISDEIEFKLFVKLKKDLTYSSIHFIFNLFRDIQRSEVMMNEFNHESDKEALGGVELEVRVLGDQYVRTIPIDYCVIPKELQPCADYFQKYYKGKCPGRNLTWLLEHGRCELTIAFNSNKYTLVVNPHQAAILLLFNTHNSLKIQQIHEATMLQIPTIKSYLSYFLNPKHPLLTKNSSGRDLEDSDEFSVCADFSYSSLRVCFVPKHVMNAEVDYKAIDKQRRSLLDGVIVRTAKRCRTVNHEKLVREVSQQVTVFRPQPTMIEEQIEGLIPRKHLRRDERNKTVYTYIS